MRRNPYIPPSRVLSLAAETLPDRAARALDEHRSAYRRAVEAALKPVAQAQAGRLGLRVAARGGEMLEDAPAAAPAAPTTQDPRRAPAAGVAERGLAGISDYLDPRYRHVTTAHGGGGVPIRDIQLDYTEMGIIPDGFHLRSLDDAARLIEWLNAKYLEEYGTPGKKGYRKTVVMITWDDGSRWRGRFDVDGTLTDVSDMFDPEQAAGGITWENTTDPDKVYAYDTVLRDVPPLTEARLDELAVEAADADAARRVEQRRVIQAAMDAVGAKAGVIYRVPWSTREVPHYDTPYKEAQGGYYFRLTPGSWGYDVVTYTPGGEVKNTGYVTSPESLTSMFQPYEFSSALPPEPTTYTDFSEIPKPVSLRDVAKRVYGGKYATTAQMNAVLTRVLTSILMHRAGAAGRYKVKVRGSQERYADRLKIDITPNDDNAVIAVAMVFGGHHGLRSYDGASIPAQFAWAEMQSKRGDAERPVTPQPRATVRTLRRSAGEAEAKEIRALLRPIAARFGERLSVRQGKGSVRGTVLVQSGYPDPKDPAFRVAVIDALMAAGYEDGIGGGTLADMRTRSTQYGQTSISLYVVRASDWSDGGARQATPTAPTPDAAGWSLRYVNAPKAGSSWWNVGAADPSGKAMRYGYNPDDGRWARGQAPPASVIQAAVAEGLPFGE